MKAPSSGSEISAQDGITLEARHSPVRVERFQVPEPLTPSTGAGWRRVGIVGRTAKDKDLDLEMPLTGERAFVQVKTGATAADLAAYTARLDEMQDYARMFFVYHSRATPPDVTAGDPITYTLTVRNVGVATPSPPSSPIRPRPASSSSTPARPAAAASPATSATSRTTRPS